MVVTGFGGPYVLPPDIETRTDHVVHVCAGSGIVPNYAILKLCLETGMNAAPHTDLRQQDLGRHDLPPPAPGARRALPGQAAGSSTPISRDG